MKERTFEKLAKLKRDKLVKNSKVAGLMANFPSHTQFIGVQFPGEEIICMEGSHRSTAISLAQEIGQPIDFSNKELTIAFSS